MPNIDFYKLEDSFHFSDFFTGYTRSHAVDQLKQWLNERKLDPEKVRIVHTHSERLPEMLHRYQFIFQINEKNGNLDRPKCIECESKHVISKGVSWLCKDCGRWFLKVKRGKWSYRTKETIKKEVKQLLEERDGKRFCPYPYLVPNWDGTDIGRIMRRLGVTERTALKYIQLAVP